jgi:hypothetical protein
MVSLLSGNLQHIDLSLNPLGLQIGFEGWENVFQAITRNKSLKTLSLYGCSLNFPVETEEENKDFIELLASFIKQTSLKELNLSQNDFSREATLKLLKASMENKGLNLKLENPHLSAREISELKQSFQAEHEKTAVDISSKNAAKDAAQLKTSEDKKIAFKK